MNVIEESVNCQEESLNCQEESVNCQEENKKNNAVNLERIRKTIESLISTHHIEVAKILVNHNVKLTENLNGIFINLTNLSENIIEDLEHYLKFVNNQNKIIMQDEEKKEEIENIYFKDIKDNFTNNDDTLNAEL
jgi:hypothetical protein